MRKFAVILVAFALTCAISICALISTAQTNAVPNKKITAPVQSQKTEITKKSSEQWFFLKDTSYAVTVAGPFKSLPECQEIKDWVVPDPQYKPRVSRCWQGPDIQSPTNNSGGRP